MILFSYLNVCCIVWILFNRFSCFIVGHKEFEVEKDLKKNSYIGAKLRGNSDLLGNTRFLHCLGHILSSGCRIWTIL